eukprot:NODE_308_length_1672_cov_86.117799_g276_i0.p1 GENE.NODE_308_length_1672_cov_86.117799_g276_i0~~NODE_308_length_1672_cov_86.117799_g276_i0.p1  ORF type:complete len:493 (-),score=90.39 NODE_308_length_1672_cov_86.117799_g276_i0:53-1531(-)
MDKIPLTHILSWLAGASTGAALTLAYFVGKMAAHPKSSPKGIQFDTSPVPGGVIDGLEESFTINRAKLREIMRAFLSEMEDGLTLRGSSMKMLPTYVTELPTGKETGQVFALDLGGTNFRVVQLVLEGNGRSRTVQKKFFVSDQIKRGPGSQLFDFLAKCVEEFFVEHDISLSEPQDMGFTFSFPVEQTGIASGTLVSWTKGFSNPDVEGKDVVTMLQEAFDRKGLKVNLKALVNDTVGTLMTQRYQDDQCYVGFIVGTGANAAYAEKIEKIPKWNGGSIPSGTMIVNMECGGFDVHRRVLPYTKYDDILDTSSSHPGTQPYEKMISGMYLGETVRLVLVDLLSQKLLFGGKSSLLMEQEYAFDTAYMSRIERDHSRDLKDTKNVIEDVMGLGLNASSLQDRQIVKRVCELVGLRAARLTAIGIAAIVSKIGRLDGCTVAMDGSVYEHYPHFANRINDALVELFGISAENIRTVHTRDGSGIGAGLIAAVAK